MAIVSVTEDRVPQPGKETPQGREYSRSFKVESDDPADTAFAIFNHSEIPDVYDHHPVDTTTKCMEVVPTQVSEDGLHWVVNVKYITNRDTSQTSDSADKPWHFDPVVSYRWRQYRKDFYKSFAHGGTADPDGFTDPRVPLNPTTGVDGADPIGSVENSAGLAFLPLPSIVESNLVIIVNRNEKDSQFDPSEMCSYKDTINSNPLTLASIEILRHEGLMKGISANPRFTTLGVRYWAVTYEIEIDQKTHILRLLDQGYMKIDPAGGDGDYLIIKDSNEVDSISQPVKLNGAGAPLDSGEEFMFFQQQKATNWDALDLPTSHNP